MSNSRILLYFYFLFITFFNCENEPIGESNITKEDVIFVSSELYNQLERIVDSTTNSESPITCIEFVYPITMYTFNDTLELVNSTIIDTDAGFLLYLNNLEETYSISISYPIISSLDNGDPFTINTNEELKENIGACLEEEEESIIACQQLISNCVWKVGYTHTSDNAYLGAVFNEDNGATAFTYNNNLYFGSWTPLYIQNELHINISLNNSNEVGEYFNLDWLVEYIDENSLQLTNEDKTFVIHQYCDNDYALCNNFIFTEYQIEDMPGVAEFILGNYSSCINTILQVDSLKTSIIYFESFDEADSDSNPIQSDQVYLNTSENQVIYVRIENIEEETYYIIEIIIKTQAN